MQRVQDRACLRTKPVSASLHFSLDGMIPTSTTASTSPLHQRLFLSSLAKPAISCQLHATSAPSGFARFIFQGISNIFSPQPKKRRALHPTHQGAKKSEATLSTREVYSLVVGSPGLLPVPSAFRLQKLCLVSKETVSD
jgi:hypothetical protein